MKSAAYALLSAAFAHQAAGHSIFQDLWVDGADMMSLTTHGSQCTRMPPSNSPVTSVTSTDIRCNVGGATGVGYKCPVKAGSIVTIEMHAQPGDRSCADQAIGGAHYGPVNVYLSQVSDSSTADGSSSWYKIFEDTWSSAGAVGDDDNWGTNDLNACCGKMDVPIPADTPSGDYLLRAEVIALHVASSLGGAQFYMSCYQLSVTGDSSAATAVPAGVMFPGAYSATDPGIEINIHAKMTSYTDPGPAVIAGGTTKVPGSTCSSGCAKTCTVGSSPSGTPIPVSDPSSSSTGTGGGTGTCSQAQYQQCGGTGYTGCTTCATGLTCKDVSPPYYSQCS
ncbi:carbohydrate-binding module family 1 protein [Xylariaceae sp. FL0255]|nr:carbohydrate-binding module family 1 protein [Xylariaceae sp. FL0255]